MMRNTEVANCFIELDQDMLADLMLDLAVLPQSPKQCDVSDLWL